MGFSTGCYGFRIAAARPISDTPNTMVALPFPLLVPV
jgi:hypothetical protein